MRPKLPERGDILTARTMRWILQRVAAFVRGGPGIRVATGPGGEITIVNTRKGGGGGGVEKVPFKLTAKSETEGETTTLTFKVSSFRSSVTDGTNGDAFDFASAGAAWAVAGNEFEEDITITETSFIVLRAEINPTTLAATNWTVIGIPAIANAKEVMFDAVETDEQEFAHLLIGKVTIVEGAITDVAQAVFSPQIMTHGLLNGAAVRVFESHWIHRSLL